MPRYSKREREMIEKADLYAKMSASLRAQAEKSYLDRRDARCASS